MTTQTFTHKELETILSTNYDVDAILDFLEASPEQLVSRFSDVIEDKHDWLTDMIVDDLFFMCDCSES